MKQNIKDIISDFSAAALATSGVRGLNVVPISVVETAGDEIHLFDFFMTKTAENIKDEPMVAFTCWKGFCGFQVRAKAMYEQEGEVFEEAVVRMKERFPERTLKAVIRLIPTEAYDVAPGADGEECLR